MENETKQTTENVVHENRHKRIYTLLFTNLFFTSLLVIYVAYDWYRHHINGIDIDFNFDGDISVIITVIGIFIAFSAINIYSLFNARVDEERNSLNELKLKYEKEIEENGNLKIKSEKINEKIESSQLNVFELRREILLYISINNIISNYVSIKDKGTAIAKLYSEIISLEKKLTIQI